MLDLDLASAAAVGGILTVAAIWAAIWFIERSEDKARGLRRRR